MIKYKGKDYETRDLYLDKKRGYVLVAKLILSEALGSLRGKESKDVDDQIAFYADDKDWKLSDKELIEVIYGPTKKHK